MGQTKVRHPFPILQSIKIYCMCYLKKFFWPHPMAYGILVPKPGVEPTPPALESSILTTGPPEKSLNVLFNLNKFEYLLATK